VICSQVGVSVGRSSGSVWMALMPAAAMARLIDRSESAAISIARK